MAVSSSAIQVFDHTTLHEDLTDVLSMISPEETPFLSAFGRTTANNPTHSWEIDALAAPATNAKAEAEDYSYAKGTTPARISNYTQLFYSSYEVSDTTRASNPAGYKDELAHQKMKKMKEHARDIEIALVTGTGNTGASATARSMKGVLEFITGNNTTGSGTGTQALTEVMFNDNLQLIWTACGMDGGYTAYAGAAQKRVIDGFTAGATKYVESEDKRLIAPVNVYESTFGLVKIKLHRYMTASVVAVLADDYWKTAWLQPTHEPSDIARVGSAARGVIQSELTLQAKNQAASSKITELS